jgi:hypothetical protein
VPASEAQKIQRERFALADPRVRAIYEELGAKEGKCAYAAARGDYFKGNDLLSGK